MQSIVIRPHCNDSIFDSLTKPVSDSLVIKLLEVHIAEVEGSIETYGIDVTNDRS